MTVSDKKPFQITLVIEDNGPGTLEVVKPHSYHPITGLSF